LSFACKKTCSGKIALEEQIEIGQKYTGQPNILIPRKRFFCMAFSIRDTHVRNSKEKIATSLGILKVKEGCKLLLHALPGLREFLFDFPNPINRSGKIHAQQFSFQCPCRKIFLADTHGEKPCGVQA